VPESILDSIRTVKAITEAKLLRLSEI
jgi:hypothetical protein